jgi:Kef-type K+ transport system membrane component KefB
MNLLNEALLLLGKSFVFAALAFFIVESILLKFFEKFGMVQDYIFLMSIGWCLLGAETALYLGLSYEIGAFIAGISLGASPLALKISGGLKPVREFFLILFFFSIGAQFDLFISSEVWAPALVIALFIILIKPIAFHMAFRKSKETMHDSWELGFRLGQSSEFSILVSFSALRACVIEPKTAYLIQLATILTFIISTYIVVYKYKTPISQSSRETETKDYHSQEIKSEIR